MGIINNKLYCTSTIGSIDLSNNAYYMEVYNENGDAVYIVFNDDATTNDYQIKSGETLKIYAQISSVSGICKTSEVGSLQIIWSEVFQ